ncbi:MAG: Wzz/FepE/Etk N-terminal domain-containing protein [Gemmatimonadaceae bacterium]
MPQPVEAAVERISLIGLVNVLLRHRVGIAASGLLLALVLAVPTLFAKRTYTAVASFVAQGRHMSGGAQGLAAQFGILASGADASDSPPFYVELLKSPAILGEIAAMKYRTSGSQLDSNLVERYGGDKPTAAERRQRAIDHLGRMVKAQASAPTNIITVDVTAETPGLSATILQNLLSQVNEFNLHRRQGQAAAEKEFAEARLSETNGELHAAEDRLRMFLDVNKVRTAPELNLEEDRLRRAVQMRQQLYTSLAESYQSAKLEEARDIPLISVIDPVEVPPTADPRGFLKRFMIGLLAGLTIATVVVYVREYFRAATADDPAARAEFEDLIAQTKAGFGIRRKTRRSQTS